MNGKLIVAAGLLVMAGLLVGCDSKPTPATGPPPPPPAGHANFAQQKTKIATPTTPPTTPTHPSSTTFHSASP